MRGLLGSEILFEWRAFVLNKIKGAGRGMAMCFPLAGNTTRLLGDDQPSLRIEDQALTLGCALYILKIEHVLHRAGQLVERSLADTLSLQPVVFHESNN